MHAMWGAHAQDTGNAASSAPQVGKEENKYTGVPQSYKLQE